MGKIHEVLAVENDVKAKANRALAEVLAMFKAGANLFVGQVRTYEPLNDQTGDRYPSEVKPLSANVLDLLSRVRADFGRWVDLAVSKEVSNSSPAAKSAVVVDGVEVLPELSVTALLNLEAKLEAIRDLYNAIPTNDITDSWKYDDSNQLWRSDPVVTYKTRKVPSKFVKYEATVQHPAQVEIVTIDEREGTWTSTKTSGMLSPVEKAQRLAKLDNLLQAVRKARQRANDVEATDVKVAEKIFAFIEGD